MKKRKTIQKQAEQIAALHGNGHPQIVMKPVSWLVPYERNPRKNDPALDRMCASISEYGFKVPIIARSTGEIVCGHLRTKAARKMGIAQVPVILCDEWSEAQVRAFRLLENKSVWWAEWDEDLLALEFADLKAMDFDLALTGFDLRELKDLMPDSEASEPGR